jgi:carbamoyltransferase
MKILGISAYYHDSAATIIDNGNIIAAAQEERFTTLKNDASFPTQAIAFCLKQANTKLNELDAIVFYDKPFLKFERLLDTYFNNAPKGWLSFITAMPVWLKEKLFLKSTLKKNLSKIDNDLDWNKTPLLFSNHHLSHAASAFFASGFDEAAILTIDGVGEWATASIGNGKSNQINALQEMHFPHSLGLLYSAFTYFLGFEVNAGEYKVMGLAPYADAHEELVKQYMDIMYAKLVTVFEDGSITLNQTYFKYATSLRMIDEKKFEALFDLKRRLPHEELTSKHIALAQALQQVLENVVMRMAKQAKTLTQSDNLCLAGGVALNGVANGKLHESGLFKNIFIQPAAGDAGGALGAALAAYHMHFKQLRTLQKPDAVKGSLLGPSFSAQEITHAINEASLKYTYYDSTELIAETAKRLLAGQVIGWFDGRMEFGPRALGARSIIANPLLGNMQSKLNLKVKKRESFRPFAPIMLQTEFERLFGQKHTSDYMLFVHKILPQYQTQPSSIGNSLIETINQQRSVLPAITHVDFSSRIQTINPTVNPKMAQLLTAFKAQTGYGVLINTSFNVNNQPIVCTPQQAINCFIHTDIDCLILDGHLIEK